MIKHLLSAFLLSTSIALAGAWHGSSDLETPASISTNGIAASAASATNGVAASAKFLTNGVALSAKYLTNGVAASAKYLTNGVAAGASGITSDPGYIEGLSIDWTNSTSVFLTPGVAVVNGTLAIHTQDVIFVCTAIPSGVDIVYIAIDASATTYPYGVVFTNFTTEPSRNVDKQGWYNGNDRVIHAVYIQASTSTLQEFISSGNSPVRMVWADADFIVLGNDHNPDENMQAPNTARTYDHTPLMTTEIFVNGRGSATAVGSWFWYQSHEQVTRGGNGHAPTRFNWSGASGDWFGPSVWVQVGPSRDVWIGGSGNMNNNQDINLAGYAYRRRL